MNNEAIKLYQKLGYTRHIPKGHQGVAFSYNLLGGFEQARWHLHQSIDQFKQMGNEQGAIVSLSGLAQLEWSLGNFPLALKLYTQCIDRWREGEDFLRISFEGVNMTRCLWMAKSYGQAHELIDEIIVYLKKYNLSAELVAAQIIKALVLQEMGETQASLELALSTYSRLEADKLVEPEKTLFELHSIFERANHPAASEVLADAHRIVSRLASEITDPEIYNSFLNNVPYCRWLREKFEYYGLPTIATPTEVVHGGSAQIG